MAATISITATDKDTITVKLPDGLTVKPGQPVPVEVLEMAAAFARLQERAAEAGQSDLESWCVGGCGYQR